MYGSKRGLMGEFRICFVKKAILNSPNGMIILRLGMVITTL